MDWYRINVSKKDVITCNTTLIKLLSSDIGQYITIVDKYHILLNDCYFKEENNKLDDKLDGKSE